MVSGGKFEIGMTAFIAFAILFPSIPINIHFSGHIAGMNNNLNWSIETVDYKGKVGRFTSLALDSNDYPHISYFDLDNSALKYAYWDGSQWHTETVDSKGAVGYPTALALDSKGYPHIAYFNFIRGNLKYAYWNGSKWNIETVDSQGFLIGHLAITIDLNDYPHIAYCDYRNGYLKYAYWDGQWHNETVDSNGNISWFSVGAHSIFIKNGYPNIIYGCGNELRHAYWNGSKWNIETITTDEKEICYASTALDSNGYPHISYMEDYTAKYVYWNGSKWNIETITTSGLHAPQAIVLDSKGYPHIASYITPNVNETDRDQEYIYWDGSQWHDEVIDSQGYVGGCCDIAIDSNDNPVISYCYWQHFDLKCARKTTNNPPDTPNLPLGFIIGFKEHNYSYITSTRDKDGEQVYYMFDWGDGSCSQWLGPYSSGEKIRASHTWSKEGAYLIRVKAKDIHYSESRWSAPLPLLIPNAYSLPWNLIQNYFAIALKNILSH